MACFESKRCARRTVGVLAGAALAVLVVPAAIAQNPLDVKGVPRATEPGRRILFDHRVVAEPRRASGRLRQSLPFRISTPEAEGMDGSRLAAAYVTASEIPNLYSLLVVRHGALVAERYFDVPTRTTATTTSSTGKSILGILVGIALEHGFLVNLDERMIDYFPEYDLPELDPRKREITVRHLIQMTAGYPFDANSEFFDAVSATSDYMRFALVEWPLERAPGEGWAYSNASTHLVSGILTKATGMSLLELANHYLFGRIGPPLESWTMDPQGYCYGIGHADCTPLQLATFGHVMLDRGRWRGWRVLDPLWVAAALAPVSQVPDDCGIRTVEAFEDLHYGYLWWHARVDGHEIAYARGKGGQSVVVVPGLDLVVVSTAFSYGADFSDVPWASERAIMELIATEIIPAAE